MPEVILLEDEPILLQELAEFLESLGYACTQAACLADFEQQFDPERHRLAVIDIGLPDGSGLQLIRRLRQGGLWLGVIVFSARGACADKVAGLDVGADHYLAKGCDLDELAATLAALARRLNLRQASSAWRLELGPRHLHVPDAGIVPLSYQDMQVLHCLMRQAGQSVSRKEIVQALGADYMSYDQRRLDTQMRRLRRRVHEIGGRLLPVKTLRNQGYCFFQPAEIQA